MLNFFVLLFEQSFNDSILVSNWSDLLDCSARLNEQKDYYCRFCCCKSTCLGKWLLRLVILICCC